MRTQIKPKNYHEPIDTDFSILNGSRKKKSDESRHKICASNIKLHMFLQGNILDNENERVGRVDLDNVNGDS